MAKRRRRRSKKILKNLFFVFLIITAGVVCYLVYDSYFKIEEKKAEETEEVIEGGKGGETEEKVEEKKPENEKENPKEIKQYEGENPDERNDLTGVVTYAGVSNGILRVRVNIDQFLSSGKCELVLTRDGKKIYNAVVSIVNSASTSTCEGFDVAVNELGTGITEILVNLDAEGKNGLITGKVDL